MSDVTRRCYGNRSGPERSTVSAARPCHLFTARNFSPAGRAPWRRRRLAISGNRAPGSTGNRLAFPAFEGPPSNTKSRRIKSHETNDRGSDAGPRGRGVGRPGRRRRHGRQDQDHRGQTEGPHPRGRRTRSRTGGSCSPGSKCCSNDSAGRDADRSASRPVPARCPHRVGRCPTRSSSALACVSLGLVDFTAYMPNSLSASSRRRSSSEGKLPSCTATKRPVLATFAGSAR